MNNATLKGMRMMAEAMTATDNYAVEIEIDGHWQTVVDRLEKAQAEQLSARWERTRAVKVISHDRPPEARSPQ